MFSSKRSSDAPKVVYLPYAPILTHDKKKFYPPESYGFPEVDRYMPGELSEEDFNSLRGRRLKRVSRRIMHGMAAELQANPDTLEAQLRVTEPSPVDKVCLVVGDFATEAWASALLRNAGEWSVDEITQQQEA